MLPEPFRDALILTGPTGSGKTSLGVELAERLGAEVISMDSMALYRGMDIGTAKPGPRERERVPHHLVDVLEPWESASVAWWLERAAACCREIESRGRRALFVGGTPLYLKVLVHGLFDGPPADAELRRRLAIESQLQGSEHLHKRLAEVDPISAARVHQNDVRRIVRALEVWELTGKPISEWQGQWPKAKDSGCACDAQCLCLEVPRQELYERIDRRVMDMMERGWLTEARRLLQLPRKLSREAEQALGYSELFACIEGKFSLKEAIGRIQRRSRNFAKRQLTWFRALPACQPVTKHLTFAAWGLTMA
jgi:tRNA dimethylallyltransferase